MQVNSYSGWEAFQRFAESMQEMFNISEYQSSRNLRTCEEWAFRYIQQYGYPNNTFMSHDTKSISFDVNESQYTATVHDGSNKCITKKCNVSAYDGVSDDYDGIYDTKNYLAEDEFVSSILREYYQGDGAVLEIGCATGRFSELTGYSDYTGIDLSAGMIEVTKQKYPRRTFQTASFESFYTAKKFDYIFCDYGTASYIRKGYLETKLFDLLNPNGKYFLMYYNQNYFPLAHLGLTGSVELVRMDSYMKLGNYSVVRGKK